MRVRINFNPIHWHNKEKNPNWLTSIIIDFLADNDTKISSDVLCWCFSPDGRDALCQWLKAKNWKVESWSLQRGHSSGGPTHFAFGLDFDESCSMFIEHKLKS